MRPLQIIDKPNMAPYVCAVCGSGPTSREHFVDLGIDSLFHSHDQFHAEHLTDGVIYFCNLCMTSAITSYLSKVFEFINNQKIGHELHSMQNSTAMLMQQKEITDLSAALGTMERALARKVEEVRQLTQKDFSVDVIAEAQQEKTADQVLNSLFGDAAEKEVNTDEPGRTDDSSSDDSNSDTIRTDQSSDGDNSAVKSLVASDLVDLKLGTLIRPS